MPATLGLPRPPCRFSPRQAAHAAYAGVAAARPDREATVMLYETYQVHSDVFGPVRWMAQAMQGWLTQPWPALAHHPVIRSAAAACEMVARSGMWHERPDFGIRTTMVDGREVAVEEVVALHHPFCTLRRFKKATAVAQPRVLLVAPLSGHFATLLRGTVQTLLPEHDVYVTDWINALSPCL